VVMKVAKKEKNKNRSQCQRLIDPTTYGIRPKSEHAERVALQKDKSPQAILIDPQAGQSA